MPLQQWAHQLTRKEVGRNGGQKDGVFCCSSMHYCKLQSPPGQVQPPAMGEDGEPIATSPRAVPEKLKQKKHPGG